MSGRLPRFAFVPALIALTVSLPVLAPPAPAQAPVPTSAAGVDSLVLQSGPGTRDAGAWLTYPDTNYGDSEYYYAIGLPGRGLAYIEFDLSALPGDAVVSSARLSLWGAYSDGTLTLEPVATEWDELTLTWNHQPGVVSPAIAVTAPIARGLPSGDCYWGCMRSFDVTPIVAAWVAGTIANHGFRILGDTPGIGWMMASADCAVYPRPKLSVTYDSSLPVARPSWGRLKAMYR